MPLLKHTLYPNYTYPVPPASLVSTYTLHCTHTPNTCIKHKALIQTQLHKQKAHCPHAQHTHTTRKINHTHSQYLPHTSYANPYKHRQPITYSANTPSHISLPVFCRQAFLSHHCGGSPAVAAVQGLERCTHCKMPT